MGAPFPNITLADGSRAYLPPTARMYLRQVGEAGPAGMQNGMTISFSRLNDLGLTEGVRQRGLSTWVWFITEQGKKALAETE